MATLLWQFPLALAVLMASLWGAFALWFRGPARCSLRVVLIGAWCGIGLYALFALTVGDRQPAALPVFVAAFAGLCGWWLNIRPQQQRDWAADVAHLLEAYYDGEQVTLCNLRNFEWRTREDFTPHWETRTYNLASLYTVDLIVSYWAGPAIAHTLVSFGFADGRQVVFSVEVRRTQGQQFSALGGFFKQSELLLVAADERDIVRTRSNVRGEDVYLYRIALPAPQVRALFRAYLGKAQALCDRPRFYNTLFSNCTTLVFTMVKRIVPGLPWDPRLILSGRLPEYLYDLGALDTTHALAELRRRGHINQRALASDEPSDERGRANPEFSGIIREGVPEPEEKPATGR